MMKVLMCPPAYYEITWEDKNKNAWMSTERQPDKKKAWKQWSDLVTLLWDLGVETHFIEPKPGLGDMVFCANAAWGRNEIFVMSNLIKERRAESVHFARWFVENRYSVHFLPETISFEGQGDFITLNEAYLFTYGIRSSLEAMEEIRKTFRLRKPIVPIKLSHRQSFKGENGAFFYHGDTAFHYARAANVLLYYPPAATSEGLRELRKLKKTELFEVREDEVAQELPDGSRNLLLNAVYINEFEIFPWDEEFSPFPLRIRKFLESRGLKVITKNMSSFGFSGAGPRCCIEFLT